jgi:hypothetical protein
MFYRTHSTVVFVPELFSRVGVTTFKRSPVGCSRMESVSVTRTFDSPADPIREAMADIEPFMEAAGFDTVTVDGNRCTIENSVGLLTIALDLRLVETDAELAYEQVEGIFETMETRYVVDEGEATTTVTATTEFALDASIVGPLLDATVISRQRRKELTKQFDYLERVVS